MRRNGESPSFSKKEGLIGIAIVGSLIGAAAAFLLATNSGKKLKNNMREIYNNMSDEVEHFTHKAKRKQPRNLNLIIGGIAGGILGISAIVLFSNKSARRGLRENLAHSVKYLTDKSAEFVEDIEEAAEGTFDNLEERVTPWIKVAQEFVNTVNGSQKSRRHGHSTINTVADWAGLGIRLFQNLKK